LRHLSKVAYSVCTRLTPKQRDVLRQNLAPRPVWWLRWTWAGSNVNRDHHLEESCTLKHASSYSI